MRVCLLWSKVIAKKRRKKKKKAVEKVAGGGKEKKGKRHIRDSLCSRPYIYEDK
jgi:hypothetical protein